MLREDEGRILEICRSGKMTMRRGQHTSGVLRALDAASDEKSVTEGESAESAEESADIEPA